MGFIPNALNVAKTLENKHSHPYSRLEYQYSFLIVFIQTMQFLAHTPETKQAPIPISKET
jgi:hypothetical protein